MPGIKVTTTVQSGANTPLQPASGQLFLVGQFERGDVTQPVRLRNSNDVAKYFGNRVTYSDTYDQLVTFFAEGGEQAYAVRVVGTTPTIGTLTLQDRAGTPAATLKVDARNPGAWSSQLAVQVSNGPVSNTFRITITLAGNIVEDYNGLTSPADAVAKFANSVYVKVTSLGSATTAPNNNPAVLSATALTAGTDDRGTIVASNYIAALAMFNSDYGDGAVAVPGQTGSTIWNALIAHAETFNRIALLAGAKGDTSSTLLTNAASLDSENAGLFTPWVVVPTDGNQTRTISPEGYVAAMRARAHRQVGPWRAPAGTIAIATYVTDVDQTFTSTQAEDLDGGKVNVIRKFASTVRLYGWRSLSIDPENWAYLKERDLVNRLVYESQARLEKFVFETIDPLGHLLSLVNAELVGMVDPIAKDYGLFAKYDDEGNEIDPGYLINTGTDLNPPSSLVQNRINATLSVRPSPVGAMVNLVITKVGLLGGLS